ncbi:1-deoxy-D-xylulose-5-phosphate synthase [uncultured Helicobacter sp.]|uniref:1-deoxy-D-xylulose-5-phosphate synthase n=1 Tax=uncultured Helicobacter sp. TaxID=175537 RepID=UPI00374F0101
MNTLSIQLQNAEQAAKVLLDSTSVRAMNLSELEILAQGIRAKILHTVSKNGGHLSSTLGAVELIVAMHHVFDCKSDPFIFDVSHQAYAHKLITGRWEEFSSLRTFGGISGFCNPAESSDDYFIAGHSSTSISLAVGAAKSFNLQKSAHIPIALIGDGALSAGLVYEALNELGARKYPVIIILNDNEMSIAKPIGAISNYLSQAFASPTYRSMRAKIKKALSVMPESASYLAKRLEESFKLITPGLLFEELGLGYIGPIDGHNLELIISTLQKARELNAPVIIHAQTTKGKGYEIAEGHFEKWHGVSPFDLNTGKSTKAPSNTPTPTQTFSTTLLHAAKDNPKIVGVTAAMPSGTGLDSLITYDQDRFWDVAIAEQHAVTSMAAMAKEGFIPFVAIYSTFLQRAFDEIVHDVSIMSMPVRFAIDRAGIVGEDGETHQGLLDIAYLRSIPNMILFAPRDNATLAQAVQFAITCDHAPSAFRYPRNRFILPNGVFEGSAFNLGEAEILTSGKDILLIGYGNGVGRAWECALALQDRGFAPSLLDLRFLKPLDTKTLTELVSAHNRVFVFSDSYYLGGVTSAIIESLLQTPAREHIAKIMSFEVRDAFIPHGRSDLVEQSLGLDTRSLVQNILKAL